MSDQHPDYEAEKAHLAATVARMQQIVADLHSDIADRFRRIRQSMAVKDEISAYVHAMMRSDNAGRIHDIEAAMANPYFGRVDFREDGAAEFESYYIGRCKVAELDIGGPRDILVFDWRDPVSTVFYECYGGRAGYEVLGRYKYSGDVRLKRQYKIDGGILRAIVDAFAADRDDSRRETLLGDQLLLDRLREGAAEKLRDIITSIQAEQNKIIREPLHQVTVLQGVAGSGKSTVGLHRLSYLLYNEKLNPQKLIVIAPNRIFLDYISELLPDIDAADVRQLVWDDLVALITGEQFRLIDDNRFELILAGENQPLIRLWEETAALKGSPDFIRVLETYIERKVRKLCLKLRTLTLFDGRLAISAAEQLDKFMAGVNTPYNERIRSLNRYVAFRVNNHLEVAAHPGHGGQSAREQAALRAEADAFLARQAAKWQPLSLRPAYREMFADSPSFAPVKGKKYDLAAVRNHSTNILDQGLAEREDLAPMAYLSWLLDGWRHIDKFDHIVVDEAQDLNLLEFAILKKLSANGSFTVMGDLSQGIHSHRSISSWNTLLQEVFADSRKAYHEIRHSYRSAKEIIAVFNRVMPDGHSPAIPVYEIGRRPTAEKILSPEHGAARAAKMLSTFLDRGAKSIGVITKLERQAAGLHAGLRQAAAAEGLDCPIHLVCAAAAAYHGGISVLPVALAKGLEFDAVIIWDASAAEYSDAPFDARLLYVALSRAMHNLHIMYSGDLTPLLRKKAR